MDREVSKELSQEFANKARKDRQKREEIETLVLTRKQLLLIAEQRAEIAYFYECRHKFESLISDPDSYYPDVFHDGVKIDKNWVDKKKAEIDAMDINEEDKKSMRARLNEIEESVEALVDDPPFREGVRGKLMHYLDEAEAAYNRFKVLEEQESELYPCES